MALLLVLFIGASACGSSADASVTHGDRGQPYVALTFDDGLNGAYTEAVADLLEQYDMQGTFFVVARTLADQAPLARLLVDRGHLVADHSFDHVRADPRDTAYDEVARGQAEFARVLGVCPRFYRPPFGAETPFTKSVARRAGLTTVLWDVEVADWSETDASRLAANVLEKVRPGSVILLHDGSDGEPGADRSVLIEALPAILEGLRARGLQSVTLDRVLGGAGYLEGCAS